MSNATVCTFFRSFSRPPNHFCKQHLKASLATAVFYFIDLWTLTFRRYSLYDFFVELQTLLPLFIIFRGLFGVFLWVAVINNCEVFSLFYHDFIAMIIQSYKNSLNHVSGNTTFSGRPNECFRFPPLVQGCIYFGV